MCFDERTSWTTLAIGTTLNMICIGILSKIKDTNTIVPIVFILLWQYALLMQIPDALAWRYPDNSIPPKIACFLNTTQPIIALLLVLYIKSIIGTSKLTIYPVIIAVLLYSVSIVIDINKSSLTNMKPVDSCHNLTYDWWSPRSFIFYMIAILLFIWTIPIESAGKGILLINTLIFIASFIVTYMIAGANCSNSSLWCWSIASAGLVTFLYYTIVRSYDL